ncbi:hypothetical protein GALMADRAFT_70977 [Galerina marginata CBS 339.88]|uniref:CHAT domain-containing protein n=1 Tax=Galerina marginata (strain CBS 339.88) TaxID=685588 RepID=A0A067T5A9_GALM3|nr:hypothetical protein GALMADRAFT_70977 [Galerina marginata CBS 339.88]
MATFAEPAKLVYAFSFAQPDSAPQKPGLLKVCGDWYLQRFISTKSQDDIDKAIKAHELAAQLVPEDDSRLGEFLYSAGVSYRGRYQEFGVLQDLNEAIASTEAAVNTASDDHADKAKWLNDLGIAHRLRFRRTANPADISDAVLDHQNAIQLVPDGHESVPAFLSRLGSAYMIRFQSTGMIRDISEAITAHQKAVHLTPNNDAEISYRLTDLGTAYTLRFMFDPKGNVIDLSAATTAHQKAVDFAPKGHENLPLMLNNLGKSLASLYDCTRNDSDLSRAIAVQQEAVNLTPGDHPDRPAWLNNLGELLLRRSQSKGDLGDVSMAIAIQQKAIELTPNGHARILSHLLSLSNSLMYRSQHTTDPKHIDESISTHQKALELMPEGHPDKSSLLVCQGRSLLLRFERNGDLRDLENTISNLRLAASYSFGRPSVRLEAAKTWANLCQKHDPPQSLEAYDVAIQLVSLVAGVEHTIEKRHEKLTDISTLSVAAASTAVSLGMYETALEWLEQGRCIVWSQINSLRSPLDDLREYDEALADRLYRISRSLESAGSRASSIGIDTTMSQRISLQDEVNNHVNLAQEWEELLEKVRNIPRFRNFLRPKPCADLLKDVPDTGPVVVVIVHKERCDALALIAGADTPLHIPLEGFSHRRAEELHRLLSLYLSSNGVRMRGMEPKAEEQPKDNSEPENRGMKYETTASEKGSVIHEVLHDLWLYVVKPVLDGLALSDSTPDPSRIWWCATGPLAFLPIHGAGVYPQGRNKQMSRTCLSNFVISSYTPTVSALLERTKSCQQLKVDRNLSKLLMVSQPNTPRLPSIPGTKKEVRAIETMLRTHDHIFIWLDGDAASKSRVSTEMEAHSWVHFACHAIQETGNPLQSGFYLNDDKLELSEIIQKKLPKADFAFLSACQTSTGDEKLSEEAVHLAAGMMAAGYRGVVATMWSIQDRHGPKIAADFYARLLSCDMPEDGKGLDSSIAAQALHYATQQIRKTLGDSEASLLVWVPYIHMGL